MDKKIINRLRVIRLSISVKIEIDNTYVIYPHGYLVCKYIDYNSGEIGIYTKGSHKLLYRFSRSVLFDKYYRYRFMDDVEYINRML